MKNRIFLVAVLAAAAPAGAYAAPIITVTPTNPPSGEAQSPAPFTYRGTTGSRTQQVYAASFFDVAQSITAIAFRATPGSLNGASYGDVSINLSTTAFGDESGTPLSGNFADNVGADVVNVFHGALNFAAPATSGFDYIVTFTTPFAYDPGKGNLLLDVTIPAGSAVGGDGFFLASYDTANRENDGVYSVNSVFDGTASAGFANTAGTITQFTGTALAAGVPEPASWAMMVVGFGAMGVVMRRRKAASFA